MERIIFPAYILEAGSFSIKKDFDGCAQALVDGMTNNKPRIVSGTGLEMLQKVLIPRLLNKGAYAEVAHLLWGHSLFNAEPESVQLIWKEIRENAMVLIPGGGSLGKSYNAAAYFLLDWLADPLWTCVKVVSVTAQHAKRNVFAHIKNLHRSSFIPLPGIIKGESIQASP